MIALADSRELNNDDGRLVHHLISEPPTDMLDHGDYLIRGHKITALVERVTNTGLLGDIESGRMADKLSGCTEDADVVILLCERLILPSKDGRAMVQEGAYDVNYYDMPGRFVEEYGLLQMNFRLTGWHYHSVKNFLSSAALRWIHLFEYTLSPEHTAQRLLELSEYFEKTAHPLDTLKVKPFLSKGIPLGEELLSVLPGIGTVRAKGLYEYFDRKIPLRWTKTEQELAQAPGIGKITASKLIKSLE